MKSLNQNQPIFLEALCRSTFVTECGGEDDTGIFHCAHIYCDGVCSFFICSIQTYRAHQIHYYSAFVKWKIACIQIMIILAFFFYTVAEHQHQLHLAYHSLHSIIFLSFYREKSVPFFFLYVKHLRHCMLPALYIRTRCIVNDGIIYWWYESIVSTLWQAHITYTQAIYSNNLCSKKIWIF